MPPSSVPAASERRPPFIVRVGENRHAVTADSKTGSVAASSTTSGIDPATCRFTFHTLTRLSRPQDANASASPGAHPASYRALALALTLATKVHPASPQTPKP